MAKIQHATNRSSRPGHLDLAAWDALMGTYVATVQLRHSLVHRRVFTDASNALVGLDENNAPLRPLAPSEQEAFARAALRAAQIAVSGTPDPRVNADLLRQLHQLQPLHGVPVPPVTMQESLIEVEICVDPDPAVTGRYVLDVPKLKASLHRRKIEHADLVVLARDRPGQDLRGRLENAPDLVESIDFGNPPGWLT